MVAKRNWKTSKWKGPHLFLFVATDGLCDCLSYTGHVQSGNCLLNQSRYKCTRVQSYKWTRVQSYKYIRVQSYKLTRVQSYKWTRVQSYKWTRVQSYKWTRVQSYKWTRVHSYKWTRVQSFKWTRVQNYKWSPRLQTRVQSYKWNYFTIPHLGPWPLTKNLLGMGLSGPNFFYCLINLEVWWNKLQVNFKNFFSKIDFSSEDFSQISNYLKKINNIITTEPFRNITYIQCRIALSLFHHITGQ